MTTPPQPRVPVDELREDPTQDDAPVPDDDLTPAERAMMQEQPEEKEKAPQAGFPTRLGWLFLSPGKLGEQIRSRPSWFLPAAIGLALTLVGSLLMPADVFVEAMRAQTLEAGGDASAFTDETANIFKWASAGALLIFWWVILAVGAGIYSVVFAFILGDEGRFKQYLAASAWGSVIAGVGALVVTPLRIASRNPQLTLSPGTFLQTVMSEGYLLRVATGLDFFAIWAWIVTGILISKIDPRRSATSAVLIVGGIYFAFIAAFSAFNFGG